MAKQVRVFGGRGASNYELWLAQGNTGTLQQFLDQQNAVGAAARDSAIAARDQAVSVAATLAGSVLLTQTGVGPIPAWLKCTKPSGPTISADTTQLVLRPTEARPAGGNGMLIEIDGFNTGDPRQLVYPSGEQIGDNAWAAGQRLVMIYDGLKFELLDPPEPSAVPDGASEYQLIALSHARAGA